MSLRHQNLPALGVFSVAARHQNFAHAAEELHLTASAVSHHIRQLERKLGTPLFLRHARGVVLTPEGRALADAASTALADIDAVTETFGVRSRTTTTLTVATLHSFAYCWLLPRLGRFTRAHPEVRFKFETSVALARFDDAGPDVAIRYGVDRWPGLTSHFLMDEHLLPVAAPTLPGIDRVRTARDILRLPLVHDLGLQGWPDWFRAAGVRHARIPQMHIFTESTDSLQAAINGLGATLTRSRIGAPYLKAGAVIALPGPAMKARFAYHALYPAHKRPSPLLQSFVEWLQQESAADTQPLLPAAG